MPYQWTDTVDKQAREMRLWPHQSMTPRGFARFVGATAALLTLPLIPLLGSAVLWGLLPFLLLALGGIWLALTQNQRSAQVMEILTITDDLAQLTRHNPSGDVQEWNCNAYWAKPHLHVRGGPVPHYVTLAGAGREVEIGAFLSEGERKALYGELQHALRRP